MSEQSITVNGNNNVVISGTNASTIQIFQQLKKDSDDEIVVGWLDQIYKDLCIFNPKTAWNHLEKVIQTLSKRNKSDALNARIEFIKGICLYEWDSNDDWANCFILAHAYEPTCNIYMEKAIMAYFQSKDFARALKIANDLLQQTKNNPIAWALKFYLDNTILVPDIILINPTFRQQFKGVFANFCLSADCQERIETVFDNEPAGEPMDIHLDNKTYWLVLMDYRLSKLTMRQPILITPVEPEISNHVELKKVVRGLKQVLNAFEHTEKYQKLKSYRFLLAYGEYLMKPTLESMKLLKQRFEETTPNFQNKYLRLIMMVMLQVHAYQDVLDWLDKPYQDSALHYIKAWAYLKLDRKSDAEQTAAVYFEQSAPMNLQMLCQFGLFQNIMVDSDAKRSHYFKYYQQLQKYENPIIEKLAKFASFAAQYSKENAALVADEYLKLGDSENNQPIRALLSACLTHAGAYLKANEMLKPIVDFENCGYWYDRYLENLHASEMNHLQKLELLEKRRMRKSTTELHFLMWEVDLLYMIPDFKQVLEVATVGFAHHPNIKPFLDFKIIALYHLKDYETLKSLLYRTKTQLRSYNLEQLKRILPIIVKSEALDLAIELMYHLAADPDDFDARETYFSYFITGGLSKYAFKYIEVVELDCIVALQDCKTQKKQLISVTAKLAQRPMYKALLDGKLSRNRIFTYDDTVTNKKQDYIILDLYDKYLGLLRTIEYDIEMNRSIDSGFRSVPISMPFSIEKFHQLVIDMGGKEGDNNKILTKKCIQAYEQGEISFSQVLHFYQYKPFETYWLLVQHHKIVKALPHLGYTVAMDANTVFVLDFTTVPLFFELHEKLNLTFKRTFYVSYFLIVYYEQTLEMALQEPKESLQLDVSSERVIPHWSTPENQEKRIEYLQKLVNWLNTNCLTRSVREKLNLMGEVIATFKDKERPLNDYLRYWVDTIFLADHPNTFLISDDTMFLNHSPLSENKSLISSEYYLSNAFRGIYASKILPILLSFNYTGLQITKRIAYVEFNKYIRNQPNVYMNCLRNLDNLLNLRLTLHLLSYICSNRFLQVERKRIENQQVFRFVIKKFPSKMVSDQYLALVKWFFKTNFPDWLEYIQADWAIASDKAL